MIEREFYIQSLKKGQFDLIIFYSMYNFKNKNENYNMTIEEFTYWFNMFLQRINQQNVLKNVRHFWDNHFNVNTVLDINNNEINFF